MTTKFQDGKRDGVKALIQSIPPCGSSGTFPLYGLYIVRRDLVPFPPPLVFPPRGRLLPLTSLGVPIPLADVGAGGSIYTSSRHWRGTMVRISGFS